MKQFKNRLPYFPQISRIINALARRFAVLGLMTFFLTTLLIYRPSQLNRASLAVLLSPNDISNHLLLSQEYLKSGNMAAVERELTLAETLNTKHLTLNTNKVLGETLSPIKILEKIKNEPQKINNEISFWEKIIVDKPDYRDAYLQLAILNHQIYNLDKARENLQKAKEIDPNFETTKELENIFKD